MVLPNTVCTPLVKRPVDVIPQVPEEVAARKEGGPSAGERARRDQDDDAERGV